MARTKRVIFKVMIASGSMVIGGITLDSMGRHDPDFHLAELSALIRDQPQNPILYFERGEIHYALRDYEKALADYDLAERLDSDLFTVDLARGRTLLECGRAEEALPALDRFLACVPDHGQANLISARGLTSLGFHREADERFALAMANLTPRLPDHFLEWAQCRERFGPGGIFAALNILNQGLDEFGSIVSLQIPAVELELKIGHSDGALCRIDRVLAASRRKEAWLFRKGKILADVNRTQEASELMRQTLEAIRHLPRRLPNSSPMQSLRSDAISELQHLESLLENQVLDMEYTDTDE